MKFKSRTILIKLSILPIIAIAILFIFRLYFLQIVRHDDYVEKSNKQLENRFSNTFGRGSIFFEEKNGQKISSANLAEGFILSINPSKIENPDNIYQALNNIIPLDKTDFLSKANKTDDPYEELANKLDGEVAKKITALNLTGVSLISEKWRYYPANNLASHVIGFVGYKGNVLEGRYGLERYYEETLKRNKSLTFAKFFSNIFSETTGQNPDSEGDIIISIEPTVQNMLEKEIAKTISKWQAKSAGAIIMDPKSGEIFAMASLPNFNPNKYNEVSDISVFSNPLVENVFEMGSIIKPLTVSAGLDSKTINENFTYTDLGHLKVDDRTIYNYDFRGRGENVPLQQILGESLNTGVATIALEMGQKTLFEYFKNFGFGEETGIDLPGEIPGLIKNLEKGGKVETATASFGQGIALTPIETIRALSALPSGGLLPNPHLVKKIEYTSGISKKITVTEEEKRRVLKKETTDKITKILVKVVDESLKGGAYKMENYSIAAKTGTAQIANKETGGYFTDRYFHSFFGYFPAFEPRFIIFLYVEEPKADYASNTLTEPFMESAKFLLNYYQVPPDR